MNELFIGFIVPWLIVFFLGISALSLLFAIPTVVRKVAKMPWYVTCIFALIIALGAFIRFHYIPNQPRIYFDEDRYLSYAVSFARFGRATSMELATTSKLLIGKPDQAIRTTVPVINGIVLKLVGFNEHNLFITAKVFSTIQIILMFALAYMLFRSYLIALFSAAAMAVLPTPVYWAASTALDSYFVFFMLFSLVSLLFYLSKPKFYSLSLAVSSIFLLLYVRLESLLFLLVLALTWILVRRNQKQSFLKKSDFSFLIILIPVIILRGLASYSVIGEKWCCAESLPLEAFDPRYFARNILPNLEYLFRRHEFPAIISLMAIFAIFSKNNPLAAVLRLWILLYFLIYSFYYAGLFATPEFSGSYGRYFLSLIPPFVILAGLTFQEYISSVSKISFKKIALTIFLLLSIAASHLTLLTAYVPIITRSPYSRLVEDGPIATRSFLTDYIIPSIPQNAILIHPLTAYISLSGRTTVYYGDFLTNDKTIKFVYSEVKKGVPAYIAVTGECSYSPVRCEKVMKLFNAEEYKMKKKNPYGFEIAKLTLKKRNNAK